ncbi:Tannase 1 [Colletotrichum chlorophyti]|uniref:Carboxylic ester hydrolase n=1 Tax=Colletotrichum chlorophyti TaxID=708187 RepID=A0A1Q8S7Z2_9PEZI|nr:Tannase 1 [Colletotrichum chlorophyti]
MPASYRALAAALAPVFVRAATLADVCTTSHAQGALPSTGYIPGITIDASSVQTSLVTNTSVTSEWYPTSAIDYCNVTFAYSHDGLENDVVHVTYWVPAPEKFQNRYVSTGGGGLAINSKTQYIPTGIIAGAVSGITDGGFGSFNTQWDAVFLKANGTINWQSVYMFGYQAHNELATIGKEFTKKFYNIAPNQKIYSYYQGCSEGGREGWSQAQRFADQFDGLAIGAPAFRYGQQQVNHLVPNVMEQTRNYFPPSCELDKILNLTIAACDPLDGKTDGVIARSDLCKTTFDFNSTVGQPYACDAKTGTGGAGGFDSLERRQMPSNPTPAQNGTVTAEGAAFAAEYYDGLHDSQGKRAYLNYQTGSSFSDAATLFDEATGTWGMSISGLGGEWVARYLQLRDTNTLETLNNVTFDTLRDWMLYGMNKYGDSLQTTNPDLSGIQGAGGKILHVHGETDDSIPAASSVHYYESVRSIMFPGQSLNESSAAMDEFYRLYLVPGGAHCGSNEHQPGGGWPQTTLQTVIEWVENGRAPDMLNNTGSGIDSLCRWPLRPLWSDGGASFDCVYDQASIDSWKYTFDAFKVPVY